MNYAHRPPTNPPLDRTTPLDRVAHRVSHTLDLARIKVIQRRELKAV